MSRNTRMDSGIRRIVYMASSIFKDGEAAINNTTRTATVSRGLNDQPPHTVLAGPSTGDAAGQPDFRKLAADDIPQIPKSKISDFPTIPSAYSLPDAATGTKGGIQLAGDLNGVNSTAANPRVSGLQGVSVSSTVPTDGQLLRYKASTQKWEAYTLTLPTVPVMRTKRVPVTTGIAVGQSMSIDVVWSPAFGDANYTAVVTFKCTDAVLRVLSTPLITLQNKDKIVVQVANVHVLVAMGAFELHAVAIHD